jgi:GH15 family glucan-1,4-alpha-glucosidase
MPLVRFIGPTDPRWLSTLRAVEREARFLFEKMLGYANHLGLYTEELGPAGEQLGNFPQAFTHIGLISAAFELNRRLERA